MDNGPLTPISSASKNRPRGFERKEPVISRIWTHDSNTLKREHVSKSRVDVWENITRASVMLGLLSSSLGPADVVLVKQISNCQCLS